MNRKQIKEALKKEANEHTPDCYESILGASERETGEIVLFSEKEKKRAEKPRRLSKRAIFRLTALGTAAVLCLGVVLPVCIYVNSKHEIPGGNVTGVPLSATQAYGFGAVTTVALLDSAFDSPAVALLSARDGADDTRREQIEKFHDYFLMLEGFGGDGLVNTTTQTNSDEAYAEYAIKCVITGCDPTGNAVTHVMYYTETLVNEETDDGETECEYRLNGVMATPSGDFLLRGERKTSTETEKHETETEEELFVRAYPDPTDPRSYVQMEQEVSKERGETEIEYVYTVVKGGITVEKTALEFESETEGDKQEIEYKLEFLSGDGKGVYLLDKEIENGEVKIFVECESGGKRERFTVRETTGGRYEYRFSDGQVLIL